MKLRFMASIFIFISAYAPLSIIFLIQDYDFVNKQLNHPIIVYNILGISLFSCLMVLIAVEKIKFSSPAVKILTVSNRSGELINYSIPYMISFFAVDLGDTNQLLSFGFFMFLMYWLTVKTHNMFINPILACRGYNLYDVRYESGGEEFQDFILAKNSIAKDDMCRICKISENLFLVTDKNPEV
ncbi:MAG: hypothetical protein RBT15_07250 [Gudongella sp.]|jgi:hypothetical protein|nr:hypothetical protein [Gudongella sp.]